MDGDELRSLSLRLLFVTLGCGVVAAVTFALSMDPFGPDFSLLFVPLAGVAVLANFAALVSGGLAWFRDGEKCPWIVLNGIAVIGTVWWGFELLSL